MTLVNYGWRASKQKAQWMHIHHLSMFCKFHNTDPDQLIKLNDSVTQLKTMILNYIIHLKKVAKRSAGKPKRGELSVNSIKHYLTGVKSFLEFNEIALPWKKIAKFEQFT